MLLRIVTTLIALVITVPAFAVAVGDPAPEVALKDVRYLPRTLEDFGDHKAYVFFTTTNGCPVAERYMSRLQSLYEEYHGKDVEFAAVNVSPQDTIKDVAYQALEYEVAFPFVKDTTGDFIRDFGVTRTAQVFVLDADHVVRYIGRVDDQYRLGGVRPEVNSHDLRNALDAILAGNDVPVTKTEVEGCAVAPPKPVTYSEKLTYAEDIAPILNANCVTCHRPDGGAPFSLLSYKDASGFATMIAEVVQEERMPPWYAHPKFGDWANARVLTDEEKKKVMAWAHQGARPGPLDKAPEPPEFSNKKWENGEPDLVVTAEEEEVIPAEGYIPYRYVTLPYEFPHDTYVQGIEIRPSTPEVVHHANLLYQSPDGVAFLSGKVPGSSNADMFPGEAMVIPKGARLIFQIHYVTTGKEERDQISVGFRFAEGKVERLLHNQFIEDKSFEIPAGDPFHEVTASWTVPENITARALFSHMHLRGRDMTFEATYPGGSSETLLVVPNYSFDWQLAYEYEPGTRVFEEGTEIEITAHFDNSDFNVYNPDPSIPVKYGPQTIHEMAIGVMYYTKNNEKLNLQINPETGAVISDETVSD